MPNLRFPCFLLAAALVVSAAQAQAQTPAARFDEFARGYLDAYLAFHPVRATRLGIHDHDTRLPRLSRESLRRRGVWLHEHLTLLREIDAAALPRELGFDHRILEHAIQAELLELEQVRNWQRNPMFYNRILADGVALLADRRFAPLEHRLRGIVARLDGFAGVIRLARRNLDDVPPLWAEMALRQTHGTVQFLENLPQGLREQGLDDLEPAVLRRWERARRRALRRVRKFAAWLEHSLAPRADGDFRLGRDLFERKLFYEEHVALDADELVRRNDEAIRNYRAWAERTARAIDDTRTTAQVVEAMAADHPSSADLVSTARDYVEQARDLVVARNLITLPPDPLPVVRPSPAYARSGFASMSAPGPFEAPGNQAYYNITTVDPSWPAQQQAEHLTYFNHPGLLGISVHEVMPGHFVQLVRQRELPSDVRKVFAPASLIEGWAHYVEQMMVDEGLGGGSPAVRLGQLRRALQRHARWYAGMALHVDGVTVGEAARQFERLAFFAPFPALREVQRGTYDPTYLYYALGRLQILELREDYRRRLEARGERFSLREFHDRFLGLGLPIPLAREALLGRGHSAFSFNSF